MDTTRGRDCFRRCRWMFVGSLCLVVGLTRRFAGVGSCRVAYASGFARRQGGRTGKLYAYAHRRVFANANAGDAVSGNTIRGLGRDSATLMLLCNSNRFAATANRWRLTLGDARGHQLKTPAE
jgi:hypothetical protein